MKRLLLTLCLLLLTSQVLAQSFTNKITIRQWTNDLKLLHTKVLEPLNEQFTANPCPEDSGVFYGALFNQLKTLRSEVNSITYLLFREIVLNTAEDFGDLERDMKCEATTKWAAILQHVGNKIEYTGNVFAILDIAGSL